MLRALRPGSRALALAALVSLCSCFGGGELSDSGRGLPDVTVQFPDRARPGTVQRARLEVGNPGPGDIDSVVVAFARVGAPAVDGLPNPIVDPGRGPDSGTVVEVAPSPEGSSKDVLYRFGPLPEDETTGITFDLRVPRTAGLAANSVTVYDAADPSRARGVRLATTVEE